MIEKNLAYLSFELIMLLTKVFQNGEICLETYISNTMHKIDYLKYYIKHNEDFNENIRITNLITQYNVIVRTCSTSAGTNQA